MMAEELRTGEIIRILRTERGSSQEALAEVCGVSMQAVSKWENGQSYPDITLLPKLAEYFQVTVDYLLTGRERLTKKAAQEKEADGIEAKIKEGLEGRTEKDVLYVVQYRNGEILDKEKLYREELEKEGSETGKNVIKIAFPEEFNRLQSGLGLRVDIWGSAFVEGEICGDVCAGNGLNCGEINGDAHAGGGINCGEINGTARAGGSINCQGVNGDVEAGGNIACQDIAGDAKAGCNIQCRDIEGDARAGLTIECERIEGDASACEVKRN